MIWFSNPRDLALHLRRRDDNLGWQDDNGGRRDEGGRQEEARTERGAREARGWRAYREPKLMVNLSTLAQQWPSK